MMIVICGEFIYISHKFIIIAIFCFFPIIFRNEYYHKKKEIRKKKDYKSKIRDRKVENYYDDISKK